MASCQTYPLVNNNSEISILYKDLLKMTKDRPLTNLIYAAYVQSQGVGAQMSAQGFKVNKQGQHNAKDVYKFFDVNTMKREATSKNIFDASLQHGIIDNLGNKIIFTDAEQALQAADNLNAASKGITAYVVQKGNEFTVEVNSRNAGTHLQASTVREQIQIWDVLKQVFNGLGVDITSQDIDKNLVNAVRGEHFVQWLHNTQRTANRNIPKEHIKILLQISENIQPVQRLKQMFGDLDAVADKIYEAYRVRGAVTSGQFTLIDHAMDLCKQYNGLDLNALEQQVASIKLTESTSPEASLQQIIDDLHRQYNININEIHSKIGEIKSLKDAASKAAATLQRQLRRIQDKVGPTADAKRVEQALTSVMRDIQSNKYYVGVLKFLQEANIQFLRVEQMLQNIPQSGTALEKAAATSSVLTEVRQLQAGYLNIVTALADIDSLISTEYISDADKQTLKTQATQLRDFFKKYDKVISALEEGTMLDIATEFLGDQLSNGMVITDLLSMAVADSSIYDYLYSMGRVSNPLVATMGNIIRDAQNTRDKALQQISLRIRRAERKLRKSGSNSRFMYESNGYIISDLDWDAYNRAKSAARKSFYRQGLRGVSLNQAMRTWEENKTEYRTVDYTNGRTEKVPGVQYRKDFPDLTPAQLEYYNTMMQIKGELGSLLPDYAQKQYIPPQIRRSFLDAVTDAFRKGIHLKDLVRALLNKFRGLYTIWEDDPFNPANGIIEGEEFNFTIGEMDDTPYRQIPIFYVNALKDQRELLKNFSTGLQHLAGTAINYDAMNKIKDTIDFMSYYIKKQQLTASNNGIRLAESIQDRGIRIFQDLVAHGRAANTENIINGFIDQHFYGVKLKNYNKWTKFLKNLIAYNSIRSLAVNVKGAISNYLVGEIQMMIEAGAGEFYNPADYAWAHIKVFGDNTLNAPGRIVDFVMDRENSESVLLSRLFDPLNDSFNELSHHKYYRGPLRHLLGHDFTFMGYGAGEHMIHYVNMYAVLRHEKVMVNGKKKSLYSVFKVGNKQDGNSELIIDPNALYKDDNGNWVPIDDKYLDKIRKKIRYVNQTTHGSMNEEDKGLIHQWMLGRFAMNLRQWMVEHYSRRFRKMHWDDSLGEEREGYHRTMLRFVRDYAANLMGFQREAMLRWDDMTEGQKRNVFRSLAEHLLLGCLYGLSFALGEPEDHKREFWTRMWIYQVRRSIVDTQGSVPWGIPTEMNTLINSPIAATNTINALMYPVIGLPDLFSGEKIKSGKHKGEYKYLRNIYKYWLPFTKHIEQLQDFDTDESVFQVFDKSNL